MNFLPYSSTNGIPPGVDSASYIPTWAEKESASSAFLMAQTEGKLVEEHDLTDEENKRIRQWRKILGATDARPSPPTRLDTLLSVLSPQSKGYLTYLHPDAVYISKESLYQDQAVTCFTKLLLEMSKSPANLHSPMISFQRSPPRGDDI